MHCTVKLKLNMSGGGPCIVRSKLYKSEHVYVGEQTDRQTHY